MSEGMDCDRDRWLRKDWALKPPVRRAWDALRGDGVALYIFCGKAALRNRFCRSVGGSALGAAYFSSPKSNLF